MVMIVSGALLGFTAGPASAADVSFFKERAYEYQARCVRWVATNDTCYRIFERTTDAFKQRACTIFVSQGVVTVLP